jgi:hypothetical protein
MPRENQGESEDEEALVAQVRASGVPGTLELTPEQMRQLAEKLYAMLRDDARAMRARRQEPHVRR